MCVSGREQVNGTSLERRISDPLDSLGQVDPPERPRLLSRNHLHDHGDKVLSGLHQELVRNIDRNVERVPGSNRIRLAALDGVAPDLPGARGAPADDLPSDQHRSTSSTDDDEVGAVGMRFGFGRAIAVDEGRGIRQPLNAAMKRRIDRAPGFGLRILELLGTPKEGTLGGHSGWEGKGSHNDKQGCQPHGVIV